MIQKTVALYEVFFVLFVIISSKHERKEEDFLKINSTPKDFFPTEGYSVKPSNILTSHFQARR